MLTLELESPSLPAGKKIVFDLTDPATVARLPKNPVTIKEGVEYQYVGLFFVLGSWDRVFNLLSYSVRITFKVNHSIITYVFG